MWCAVLTRKFDTVEYHLQSETFNHWFVTCKCLLWCNLWFDCPIFSHSPICAVSAFLWEHNYTRELADLRQKATARETKVPFKFLRKWPLGALQNGGKVKACFNVVNPRSRRRSVQETGGYSFPAYNVVHGLMDVAIRICRHPFKFKSYPPSSLLLLASPATVWRLNIPP